jgi:hypothetical protein
MKFLLFSKKKKRMNTIESHGTRIYFKMIETYLFLFLFLSNVQVMRY